MEKKLREKMLAALDAADVMYSEFMDASCNVADQYHIYKAQYAKVKAARKALEKEQVAA